MSENLRDARDTCARYAPTLALLDEPRLDGAERRAALEHLAICARCQADQRAYAQLDDGLRRAFGPVGSSSLRTADLLAAIGATHEPTALPHWAARPTSDAIRSVVYLGDFDDLWGRNRMSEADERDMDSGMESAAGETPARRLAAIPSLRPALGERAGQGRAWTLGYSAVAAVVVFVVVATAIFASHAAQPGIAQTAHSAATRTAASGSPFPAASDVAAVSMVSPTDGWALGDATTQQSSQQASEPTAALYHFDGSQWRLTQQIQGFPIYTSGWASLTMLSATDGWAFSQPSHVLHYDGTAWRSVTISLAGGGQPAVQALGMLSPTDGWAATLSGDSSSQAPLDFLHYDGQQWKRAPSAVSAPGVDMRTLVISGFSAAPGGDVWAVGYAFAQVTQGSEPLVGLIFHRVGGVWRVASMLNQPNASIRVVPHGILMTGSASGWIVGETDQTTTVTQLGGGKTLMTIQRPLLLRYDGARWTHAQIPLDTVTTGESLQQIVATGASNIWIMAQPEAQMVSSNGVALSGQLLHYDGNLFSAVPLSITPVGVASAGIHAISVTGNGDVWAVGGAEKVQNQQVVGGEPFFCRYSDGAWSVAAPLAG